jgi:tRNA U55 pseudouridine synthase TruB
LETLRRTEFGEFFLTDALPLQLLLERQRGELPILSPAQAMHHYRAFRLTSDEMVNKLRQGQQNMLRSLPTATKPQEIVTLVSQNDELVAVIEDQQNHWRLVRVL